MLMRVIFFTFNLTSTSGSSFFLYDGDTSKKYELLNNDQFGRTVYIVNNGSSWWATFDKQAPTGGFELGATPDFMFMFTSANGCDVTQYDVALGWGSTTDAYALTAFCDVAVARLSIMTVVVTDVTPVPIPGAMWLFGSGLIGLLGFRRLSR